MNHPVNIVLDLCSNSQYSSFVGKLVTSYGIENTLELAAYLKNNLEASENMPTVVGANAAQYIGAPRETAKFT